MTEDQAAMTPEERLAANLCCECCADLTKIDVPHHSLTHWPQFIRPDGLNAEAIRRQGLMAQYTSSTPPVAQSKSTEAEHKAGESSQSESTASAPASYKSESQTKS